MMRFIRHSTLLLLNLLWLIPLYFVLINAATPSEGYGQRPPWTLPVTFGLWENLVAAWRAADFGQSVASTLLYGVVGAGAAVFIAALASFAIVGLRVRQGFLWFMLIYVGTIFPFQMYLAPLFSAYAVTNLYDTRLGLLLIYTAITVPFAVFVIRNHFTTIPRELPEAARLDGASSWIVFWRIYMPLSFSALAAVFVFQFTFIWNDLLFGLVLSRSVEVRPIMTALATLQGGQYGSVTVPVILAGALIVSVPTLVLFFTVQRLFVAGLRATS
jgi:multiple sugar transport system permease protein